MKYTVFTIAYGGEPVQRSQHRSPNAAARVLGSFISGKRRDPAFVAIYALDDKGMRWSWVDLKSGMQRFPVLKGHPHVRTYRDKDRGYLLGEPA